jgi:hypothetical protein
MITRSNNTSAPFGAGVRAWSWLDQTVTVTTANVRQKLFPRGNANSVEQVTFQAAVSNTDFITLGAGTVAINTGVRQLMPGATLTLALAEDAPTQSGEVAGHRFDLHSPVEVVNVSQFFMISATAGQILLVSLWWRQPSG